MALGRCIAKKTGACNNQWMRNLLLVLALLSSSYSNAADQVIRAQSPLVLSNGFMSLPTLTTKGDIMVRGTSGYARLPVGTDDYTLIADSAQPLGLRWAPAGSGSVVWGGITGTLSNQTDLQSALNAKQNTLTLGALSTSTTGVTVTGGTGAVIGAGTTVNIQTASTSQPGLLSAANWNTFNNKQNALSLGNLTTPTTGVSVTGGTGAVVGSGAAISIQTASGAQPGLLSSADWTTFNSKQAALSLGNVTSSTTGFSIAGGTGAVVGTGMTLNIQTASGSQPGLLSAADWTTFNGKQNALSLGNLTSGTTGVTITGGTGSVVGAGASVSVQTATSGQPGLLSAADWTTFNSKQAAGNYITALSGDVTASGPGSASASISSTTVTGKLLTGFSASAGTVAAADSILIGFNKVVGNIALRAPLASPTFTGTVTLPTAVAGLVEEINGQVQTMSNATFWLIQRAPYARTVNSFSVACNSGGSVTAALKINGTNVTGCSALSVTSSNQNFTCTAANAIAATDQLTLETTSNSSCLDFSFTIPTTRN